MTHRRGFRRARAHGFRRVGCVRVSLSLALEAGSLVVRLLFSRQRKIARHVTMRIVVARDDNPTAIN